MLRYIVRRLLMMIPVLIGATLIVFAIMDSSPGDPALSKVGVEASPEQVEEMRESMGLNDPFLSDTEDSCWGCSTGIWGLPTKTI